jgi:hypothetical protein
MLSGSARITSTVNPTSSIQLQDQIQVQGRGGGMRKRLDSLDTLSLVAYSNSGNQLSLLLPVSISDPSLGYLPWETTTQSFDATTPVVSHSARNVRSASFSSAASNTSTRSEVNTPLTLPFSCPPHLYSKEGRIGAYLKIGERAAVLSRFMEKRAKRRFAKRVRYDCRKDLADIRIRVKGRFIKAEQSLNIAVAVATSHSEIATEESITAAAAADLAMLPSSSSRTKELIAQAPAVPNMADEILFAPIETTVASVETQEQLRNAFVPIAALSGDAIRRAFEKVEAKRLAASSFSPQPSDATPRIRSQSGDLTDYSVTGGGNKRFRSENTPTAGETTRSRRRTMSTIE